MGKFSRWMPHVKTRESSVVAFVLILGVIAATWPFMVFGYFALNRHLRRLAQERSKEDIGTFARNFDRRTEPFDPWVIRATWDALTPYVEYKREPIALRANDSILEDLCIDPDDIFFDVLPEVAKRSRHSLDDPKLNPHFGKIETVGDLVRFITCQPRLAGESPGSELK